jgi:hypothetical protein
MDKNQICSLQLFLSERAHAYFMSYTNCSPLFFCSDSNAQRPSERKSIQWIAFFPVQRMIDHKCQLTFFPANKCCWTSCNRSFHGVNLNWLFVLFLLSNFSRKNTYMIACGSSTLEGFVVKILSFDCCTDSVAFNMNAPGSCSYLEEGNTVDLLWRKMGRGSAMRPSSSLILASSHRQPPWKMERHMSWHDVYSAMLYVQVHLSRIQHPLIYKREEWEERKKDRERIRKRDDITTVI